MSKKMRFTMLGAMAALAVITGGGQAFAQEVQVTGPLAGASAVRHMRVYREGRFQIQPFAGFTLQDEYSRTIFFGGQLQYHLTDWLGIGVWGGYGGLAQIDTGLTDQIAERGQTTDRNRLSLPTAKNFPEQIGKLKWVGALQLTFIPLRGKLALFQDVFLDTDFYIFAGVAGVGVEERADTQNGVCATDSDACRNSQVTRASRVAVAPTFGAGLTLYATKFMGITIEWRGLPFAWNTSGTDERGRDANGNRSGSGEFPDGVVNSNDRILHFNHMVNLGIAFFLPTSTDVTK